ncbi:MULTISPECIES: hypothetical protein [Burkholderia]|uniref:hypothetical protein n=1 Tax=Burkholderia sp. BCC1988 TaxID=2817443 RepID=UPI002AB0AC99|nr:hypothetical protein [Burkholderia sp. BCC1988]
MSSLKVLFPLLLAASLAACAGLQSPPKSRSSTAVPITCASAKSCESMWIAAGDALQNSSGMKLRLVTESRLETFTENNYGRMLGTATKRPMPDGSYQIVASFSCYSYPGCDADYAAYEFNALVNMAGSR